MEGGVSFTLGRQTIKKVNAIINSHFSEEDILVANKHLTSHWTPFAIREILIKTTVRYYITLTRIAITKNTVTSVDKDMEKWEPSLTAGENVKCHSHLENSQVVPQNIKIVLPFDPVSLHPGIYPREIKIYFTQKFVYKCL